MRKSISYDRECLYDKKYFKRKSAPVGIFAKKSSEVKDICSKGLMEVIKHAKRLLHYPDKDRDFFEAFDGTTSPLFYYVEEIN